MSENNLVLKEKVEPIIFKSQCAIIRTTYIDYFEDCAELLSYLTVECNKNVIIVSFETELRDLYDEVKKREGDTSKLSVIDAISIISGRGTPPISKMIALYKPDDFNDIAVYSKLLMNRVGMKNVAVVFLSIYNLKEFQNDDEIGVFLQTYYKMMRRKKIPVFIIAHDEMPLPLDAILESKSDSEVVVRKIKERRGKFKII